MSRHIFYYDTEIQTNFYAMSLIGQKILDGTFGYKTFRFFTTLKTNSFMGDGHLGLMYACLDYFTILDIPLADKLNDDYFMEYSGNKIPTRNDVKIFKIDKKKECETGKFRLVPMPKLPEEFNVQPIYETRETDVFIRAFTNEQDAKEDRILGSVNSVKDFYDMFGVYYPRTIKFCHAVASIIKTNPDLTRETDSVCGFRIICPYAFCFEDDKKTKLRKECTVADKLVEILLYVCDRVEELIKELVVPEPTYFDADKKQGFIVFDLDKQPEMVELAMVNDSVFQKPYIGKITFVDGLKMDKTPMLRQIKNARELIKQKKHRIPEMEEILRNF